MPPDKDFKDVVDPGDVLGVILGRLGGFHPGDPGPEVYAIFSSLSQDQRRGVASAVSEAVGAIADVKGTAYGKIANIIGSQKKD